MPSIGFDHIELALPRIADAVPFLVGVLGGVPSTGAQGGPEFRFGTWHYANGGRIEVIEPIGDDGFVHRFLAGRGPGIHHVTFKVPSLDEACDRARARGYDIVSYDDSDEEWKTAFLHPKQALGIVVQFAETPVLDGPYLWTPPVTATAPPPPVHVLGLRMRVSVPDRAHVQWVEVLRGACAERAAERLVYHWPDSPMSITVEVDPTVAEGPVAIELAADRPLALPAGPVLGAVFSAKGA